MRTKLQGGRKPKRVSGVLGIRWSPADPVFASPLLIGYDLQIVLSENS